MSESVKLLIWTRIPTHHQSAFFQAIRDQGIDLVVHYYRQIPEQRLRLGWAQPRSLPRGENYVEPRVRSLSMCNDWRERIHIVPGCSNLFLLLLAIRLSSQAVPWVHWSEPSRVSSPWRPGRWIRSFYAGLLNRWGLGALAIGDMARKDFIVWGMRPERIHFLPYSIAALSPERERTGVTSQPPRNAIRFLFLGVLCHRKATDVLLEAFAQVVRVCPEARLDLVGFDPTGGTYARQAAQLGIERATHFIGSVPVNELSAAIEVCDVLVLPSRFDGWGVVLNEGASMGKALISTEACGAAHHLIVEGRNGFRVPPADAAALAERMLRYCHEPALARMHGSMSRTLFQQFTPLRNASRLGDALRTMLAKPRPT